MVAIEECASQDLTTDTFIPPTGCGFGVIAMTFWYDWPTWLAYLLAAFFCINGVINVIGPKGMRNSFAAWGYPPGFHIANGVIQVAAGMLLSPWLEKWFERFQK